MTLPFNAGVLQMCDTGPHICDDNLHTCVDEMPTSTATESFYELTVANNNELSPFFYYLTAQATCSSGDPIDYSVCEPVIGGMYPTACVFTAGAVGNFKETFAVDGCSCQGTDAAGCSLCWDGSAPTSCQLMGSVQYCSSVCPPQPSLSQSQSLSVTRSQDPSSTNSPSQSRLSTNSPSVTSSPDLSFPPKSSSATSALSPGAIAGITIGTVLIAILLVVVAIKLWVRQQARRETNRLLYGTTVAIAGQPAMLQEAAALLEVA